MFELGEQESGRLRPALAVTEPPRPSELHFLSVRKDFFRVRYREKQKRRRAQGKRNGAANNNGASTINQNLSAYRLFGLFLLQEFPFLAS